MGISFYGDYLKKARERAGISQEKLAEGIINLQSLNRIENNRAGVSPGTFQALTSKCGAPTEVFPLFPDWDDFNCFYELYKAEMWLGSWQTKEVYNCLQEVEKTGFAGNAIYYQKWLYYQAALHMRNGDTNYEEIMSILQCALKITKEKLSFEDIKHEFLTVNEIMILTAIAKISFMEGNNSDCLLICSQLSTYLENVALSYKEKADLILGVQKIYVLYLIRNKEYLEAMNEASLLRDNSLLSISEKHMIEAAFLFGLTKYLTGETKDGIHFIKTAYYSGEAIESQFATVANEILNVLNIEINELKNVIVPSEKKDNFAMPDINRKVELRTVECDYYSDDVITLGRLIHQKRKDQKLSMKVLCQGLCSVSALSKIENDALQPDIFLARSLIQRLGMSDEPFTFYASERETRQYRLERQMTGESRYNFQNIGNVLDEMKKVITKKDIIFKQLYTNNSIFYGKDIKEKNLLILENIKTTLPDFSVDRIIDYRLSKYELSYVISYCMMLRREVSVTKAIKVLYKILDYMNQNVIDDLLKNTVMDIVIATLVGDLDVQKRYDEIIDLLPMFKQKIVFGDMYCLPYIYAGITDAYIEEGNECYINRYYKYTYYLFEFNKIKAGKAFLENVKKKLGQEIDL